MLKKINKRKQRSHRRLERWMRTLGGGREGEGEFVVFHQSHRLLGFSASSAVSVRAAAALLSSQETHLNKCFELI